MEIKIVTFLFLLSVLASGCAAILKPPVIIKHGEIKDFSFVVLPKAATLSSGSGGVYGNQFGVYGETSNKEISPSNKIEGVLLKKGLFSTDIVTPENENKTLIVKYGESGKRDVAGGLGGYTLEVTIAIFAAKTNEIVYSCVAEGQGSTEADDIREAILRCLSSL